MHPSYLEAEKTGSTWLWTASFFIWDGVLFHERVCINRLWRGYPSVSGAEKSE